ncbi:MAG TPA: hypothetical protein VFZ48_01395 [Candidatus Saccharimonadales bacterium]
MKHRLSAVGLQRLLVISLIFLIGLSSFGFYMLGDLLRTTALASNHAKIDATLGRNDVEQLERLEAYLNDNEQTVRRASGIVADTKEYQYQNQIVADINTYAGRAGVTVLGFNFSATTSTDPKTQNTQGTNTGGIKTLPAILTLKNPVAYRNFLRFIKAIEQNLTKMQIKGITMSPETSNSANITNPTIELEIYVR